MVPGYWTSVLELKLSSFKLTILIVSEADKTSLISDIRTTTAKSEEVWSQLMELSQKHQAVSELVFELCNSRHALQLPSQWVSNASKSMQCEQNDLSDQTIQLQVVIANLTFWWSLLRRHWRRLIFASISACLLLVGTDRDLSPVFQMAWSLFSMLLAHWVIGAELVVTHTSRIQHGVHIFRVLQHARLAKHQLGPNMAIHLKTRG